MRLYKTKAVNVQAGAGKPTAIWSGTQADSRQAKKELMDAHDCKQSAITQEQVDVPTDKTGMLAFLNENLSD